MSAIGKPERVPQNGVIGLFSDEQTFVAPVLTVDVRLTASERRENPHGFRQVIMKDPPTKRMRFISPKEAHV